MEVSVAGKGVRVGFSIVCSVCGDGWLLVLRSRVIWLRFLFSFADGVFVRVD